MKSIIEYIKESLITEGGHSINGVEPIRGDLAKVVADEIISKISKEFKCNASALGSTGKKSKEQTSGDIDIALELSWEDKDKVIDYVKKEFSDSIFGNIVNQLHVFNIGYKYNDGENNKFVQVDFMFVDDIEYAKFVYHSPSFINNESKFKGAWNSTLLRGIIACTPVSKVYPEYKDETFEDGSIKSFWKLTFSQADGLFIDHKTYEGKNKKLSSPKTIKEDRKYLTKNIEKILHTCLGKDCTKADCNSYETILAFISSERYEFRSKEQLEKIKEWLFTNTDLLREMSESTIKEAENLFDNAIKYIDNK